MLSRRKFIGLATMGGLTMALSPVLSACSQTNTGGSGSPSTNRGDSAGSQVIICMESYEEPEAGFDPLHNWGNTVASHDPLIQSTLITIDADMRFVNDLATDFAASEDGMTWTFTIRNDVTFTDGEPLTAADVAFTINGVKSAEGSEVDLSMIKQAIAKDDVTIEIQMGRPFNALLYTLAVIGIVPEHAYGPDYGKKPIGSGRYILEQWDRGQQVILTANPNYYGKAPLMERVIIVFMEQDAAFAAAKAGEVDIAITSALYGTQSIDGYEILACKSVDSRGVSLPTLPPGSMYGSGANAKPAGNAVTSDIAVRRALNLALDRDQLVANVLNGYGTAAYSSADGMPWANPESRFTTNIEEANRLLDDAGWLAGSDGIREKDGVKAHIELCCPPTIIRQVCAQEFANQARTVGIDVQVKGVEWSEMDELGLTHPTLWAGGANSPAELYSLYHSKSLGNISCYENTTVDSYLDAALATKTVDESFPLWQKAQWDGKEGVNIKGAATWVWLAYVDHLYFKRTNLVVAKQKTHPHGNGWAVANNIDQWTWK